MKVGAGFGTNVVPGKRVRSLAPMTKPATKSVKKRVDPKKAVLNGLPHIKTPSGKAASAVLSKLSLKSLQVLETYIQEAYYKGVDHGGATAPTSNYCSCDDLYGLP
jgi:hypothetical protein